MAQESSTTSELTIDVTCTPRNRANLRRLKTSSIQSFQRWEKENELLYAMIEDESAWLSSLFPDAFITPELFFYALEDGTILCLLANFIQERAENHGTRTGKGVPGKTFTFHKSKKGTRQSKLFHSRENVDKFLTWCRWHGIPEAILFESNDAVLVDECRTGGREIVICLMEIARRSLQYEIEVPQMIKLEREIEEEELSDTRSCAEEQPGLPLETITLNTDTRGDRSPIDSDSGVESVFEEGDPASPRLLEFAADDTKIAQKNKSMNKFEVEKKPQRVVKEEERHSLLESSQPKTELDRKVCKIAQEYNIKIVHRLKEGKYIILGKTMFVRMLNDHLLVRIGGGWDTLDHYVMTHASKSTASGDQTTATPPTSERKSSGVWSKLVDKVKRRESQPSLTESPVVISKRERPDSSPSVYRLRDRVKKKLSVTEKDEKDISDAIRKIESSLTLKASRSSSFTSKTFFQLKNRFDKGRKSSREYLFDNKETKMTDQTVEVITSEQQKETETKEESGTTMLLELETSQEVPEATSTTTETELSANDSSSQKQAEENFPSEDFGLFDQQAQESSGQSFPITDPDDLLQQARESSGQSFPITDPDDLLQQAQESSGQSFPITDPDDLLQQDQESSGQSFPITDPDDLLQQDQESSGQGFPITDPDDLLQQAQESSGQGFPITDPNDLLSNDNPPLFSNEPLQPEQTRYEKQAEIHKDEEEETPVEITSSINEEASKSATDFLEEISQEIESKPNEDSANAKETPPASPAAVPDVNEPRSDIEEKLENVQESSAGEPADLGESDAIIVSLESGEVESAPRENDLLELCQGERQEEVNDHPQENDLLELCQGEVNDHPRENDLLELCQGERQEEVNDHPQVSDEQTEAILDKTEQEDDALPAQLSSHNVTSLEMEVEITTVSGEEGKLEDVDRPTQMTCEDFQFSEMKDMEYVSPDTDKEKDDEAPVSEAAVPDMVEIEKEKEPELSGADVLMPVQLDKDAVSKEREEPEESTNPAQITDEISQVESFEQEKFPGLVCLEESEKAIKEDEQLSKTIDLGEEVPKGESVGSPVEVSEVVPLDEEPKAEEDKKEKEATNVLPKAASAPVNKKTTKKAPGTTKKEHVKAGNSLASKKLSERKKEDQRGEKPKESVTKPSSTRTTKSASTTTAPKAKPVSAANGARSTSATKRPFSAQAKKTGIGASKADATKTTPKTTPKSSESRRPPGTTTTKSTATTDKKPLTTSGNQKSKSVESRPRSAVLMKSSDKKDGKAEAPSRPPSAKMKPFSGTTKTTVKKTTTTTTKTTSGPTPKSEVSKTTITTSEGGKTKTKTTMKKESGGKTKASMAASHQVSSVRNNASEKKSSVREKPGSASAKSKLSSATTTARGKPGNTVAKGKSTSERPKSPTKGTAKKSAPTKDETTVSAPAATNPPAAAEPPAISSIQQEASDLATPSVTADSKENVTSALQDTEAIKDEGETTIVQTKEVTEIVLENGEQQTTIKETVVEESG